MADDPKDSEVLTREVGVKKNILPTGRTIGVVPIKGTATYKIQYVDGKPGEVPQEYNGKYTGIHRAEMDLKRFINTFWDISDNASRKQNKPIQSAVSR